MRREIALISPYHGGSHLAWAEGLQRYSTHAIRLYTLPARFWKWRMHGGAVTLAREFLASSQRPLIHIGYAKGDEYRRLLWAADLTVSTAQHEFFGISLVEAIYTHAFPILPNRLSYPEMIPTALHDACFYGDEPGLVEKLKWALANPVEIAGLEAQLATAVGHYNWSHMASLYDQKLGSL